MISVIFLQSISQQESLSANHSAACIDLLDLLERVYFTLMRLGLYQAATEDATKVIACLPDIKNAHAFELAVVEASYLFLSLQKLVLSGIANHTHVILSKRQKPKQFILSMFKTECEKAKVFEIDGDLFANVMEKLSRPVGASLVSNVPITKRRRRELDETFKVLDYGNQ
jgi:hypothetical protein